MEKVISEELAKVRLAQKAGHPWQADEPWHQKYYTYRDGQWTTAHHEATTSKISELALYSWNIDFMLPFADSRMRKAIDHLKQLVSRSDAIASVIFLQESLQTDIDLIAADPWVQQNYKLSDIDMTNWSSGRYGTVALVDKRLHIKGSFRVHYSQTIMERDAFFTDICLDQTDKTIRLCNTHLESLALEPPRRPAQVKLCAEYMHKQDVFGAAMAGDLNAIQDFDRTLHSEHKLKDAYLEIGGAEDRDEGYTWGQQAATAQRDRFGCCRMDKVFYAGGLQLQFFERFGADIVVDDEAEVQRLIALGFDEPWITDHLGVLARFTLADGAGEKPSL